MLSYFLKPGLTQAIYAGNALWFGSAFYHFGFDQKNIMRRISLRNQSGDPTVKNSAAGDLWHHDILSYLGSMNSALAVLAAIRLYALWRPSRVLGKEDIALDVTAMIVLGVGNLSQAILNFTRSRWNDRWIMGKGFDRITVLDTLFTILDCSAALARIVTM